MVARGLGVVACVLSLACGLTSACNGVLGMSEPTLDACAGGACGDGSVAGDASRDAVGDGPALDAGKDASATGALRCGGGNYPEERCGANQVCCQTNEDASVSYGCVANGDACAGYYIACAANSDCTGTEVCCHYSGHTKCVGQTTCANDSLVCEPDGAADQCPAGWACKAPLTNAGVPSPYFACAP